MESETKKCQNCKNDFVIEPEDFDFYKKMKITPPEFCSKCVLRIQEENETILTKTNMGATKSNYYTNDLKWIVDFLIGFVGFLSATIFSLFSLHLISFSIVIFFVALIMIYFFKKNRKFIAYGIISAIVILSLYMLVLLANLSVSMSKIG